MYALIRESGHVVWKEWWYVLTLGVSLWVDLYVTWKDQLFIADVVVINLMHETMASNFISWTANASVEFNAIVKIHKYKGLHEGHHFMPMAMELYNTLETRYGSFHHGKHVFSMIEIRRSFVLVFFHSIFQATC
jgi:hypothetical protein